MPTLAFHIEDTGGVNPDNPQPFIVWDGESRWDARTLAHAMPADALRMIFSAILSFFVLPSVTNASLLPFLLIEPPA